MSEDNKLGEAYRFKQMANELKAYPEIEFKWFERCGLQFQVQFINKEFVAQQGLRQEL